MENRIKLEKELFLDILNEKSKKFEEYFENSREVSEYYYNNEMKDELASLECRVNEILLIYLRIKLGINSKILENYECTFGVRDYY